MPADLVDANAVIVAHSFNPTIADQFWLADNRIVLKEEFRKKQFADALVEVATDEFHFLLVPERCQFTPRPGSECASGLIVERLGRLVDALPHTPFQAVGINFTWFVRFSECTLGQYSKMRFGRQDSPTYLHFDTPDARYGGYFSKDLNNCRLKLDVKPLHVAFEEKPTEVMQFAFNLHRDLGPDASGIERTEDVKRVLGMWDSTRAAAQEILDDSIRGFE